MGKGVGYARFAFCFLVLGCLGSVRPQPPELSALKKERIASLEFFGTCSEYPVRNVSFLKIQIITHATVASTDVTAILQDEKQ